MKKKGFTLLELLAVIIILAVIALIATPIVLNVVDEAKKSAFQDSSYGLIKSGEYYYTSQILNGGMTSDKVFNFPNNTELEFSGTEPESGYIKVTKDGLVEIAVSNGKYCATKGLNEEKVTIKDYVEGECVIGDNQLTQLQAPTISINDNTLNIISNDENAEEYEIYVDGILKTTISAILSSEENMVSGTWKFNDVLMAQDVDLQPEIDYYFYKDGITVYCNKLAVREDSASALMHYYIYEVSETIDGLNPPATWTVYSRSWLSSYFGADFETISFTSEQEVSEEFYIWFTANATPITTFDLSSLNLENGIYDITVKAVADGYESSEFSNTVEYTVGNILSGTWKFNDVLTVPNSDLTQEIRFTFGNYTAKEMYVTFEASAWVYYYICIDEAMGEYESYKAYNGDYDEWVTEESGLVETQTITFTSEQEVTAEFYTWFTANATKQ